MDYAETLCLEDKSAVHRFLVQRVVPPIIVNGYHRIPGAIIRLRLRREIYTRYKLRRKKPVRQFLFSSKMPEQILLLLSEHGVPVQKKTIPKDESHASRESL
jgi:hypothetical protein